MKTEKIEYQEDGASLEAHLVYPADADGPRPLVVIAHAWAGQSDFERDKAADLAKLGYVGCALDMFGKGVLGTSVEENTALIQPFMADRGRIPRRLNAGIAAVREHAAVDASNIAAIGYCFGGLCVLDLARSGSDIAGVIGVHSLLGSPDGAPKRSITAKVLVLHGFDDPMAKPDQVVEFGREMTEAGADWQAHLYGNAVHAFTNPNANDPNMGTVYNAVADNRSWISIGAFLRELFGT